MARSLTVAPTLQLPSQLLTVKQVCAYLHISRATLYRRRYRYTQEVPGGPRRYFADDLALALTLNTVEPKRQ